MTLVIRATETITTPRPGAAVTPGLSVTGVIGRWDAALLEGAAGSTVSLWPDASDAGAYDLTTKSGTVTALIDETSGERAVHLDGSGYLQSAGALALPTQFTLGARLYLPAAATAGQTGWAYMTSDASAAGLAVAPASSTFRAYGYGFTSYPTSAAATVPGWVTVVATFDGTAKSGKIALNGGTVTTSTQTWSSTTFNRIIRLSGTGFVGGVKFAHLVMLDHVASDVEMASLAGDLTP